MWSWIGDTYYLIGYVLRGVGEIVEATVLTSSLNNLTVLEFN